MADTVDYIKNTDKHKYIEDILGSAAWLRALLIGQFVYSGLCGLVHAVLQIGVVYGLFLNILIEV